MELTGTKIIHAPRNVVWKALNSAETLKEAVPGCTEMAGSASEGFKATVVQKVGPVKATFKGKVTLSDVVDQQSYRIDGEGTGGAAGFASGGADVSLADHPEGTELTYNATAKVGGKLAQLGSRLIDNVAGKMADQFFANFKEAVEGGPTEVAESATPHEMTEDPREPPAEKKGFLKRIFG